MIRLSQQTMITANMHEAKSRLSELVEAVEERGEIVIIQRKGKPVAVVIWGQAI